MPRSPTTSRRRAGCILTLCFTAAFLAFTGTPVRADLEVHLTFDDDGDPGEDSSGNDLHGEIDGAQWVEDEERLGVLEFAGGNDGFVRVRLQEELLGDEFTITFWAYRDSQTASGGNDGLFQVQLGGDVPSTSAKVIGGWVAGSGGVWGRLRQQDGTQLNLDTGTFFMETEKWTHFAYRGDGETFEVVVDGASGGGPSLFYDGTLEFHDTVFIGKQGTESWGGRIDDFRVYSVYLTDEDIEEVMDEGQEEPPPCPEEGDTHCTGLDVEGPAGNVTGVYHLEAEAVDDSGDPIRYTFVAESDDGQLMEVGPQNDGTARLRLGEGTWTLSVTVDDSARCDDRADDFFCTTELVVSAGEPSLDDLEVHLAFDDDADPGMDSSGNDFHGELDGAQWVDDDEREGAVEFVSGNDGFVRVGPIDELPGEGFTITLWAYRDSLTAGGGNDGLFQVQIGGDTPSTSTKVIGGWVAGTGGVWGRLRQEDGTQLNLDRNTFLIDSDAWVHLAYRGDGEIFDVVVNGESGVGPSLSYDGTLELHDTVFIGKQGTESWGGRMDDFRIYSRALTDAEIALVMEDETEPPPCPMEGDTHCTGLNVEGPPANVTGVYRVEAEATDDSGDPVRYTFVAESGGGERKEIGPQTENTGRFRLSEGTWTLSVTVDDSLSCDDRAGDATCTTQLEVKSGDPSRRDLEFQLTFDDDNEPGFDSSGNALHGEVDGAVWVEDEEDDRAGVLEFVSGDDGFVRVDLAEALPDGFTFTFWAYRDVLTAGTGNDGLFQVQLGGDTPSTSGAAKTIGAWVAADGGVWGRLHQQDGTQLNLDRATFFMESDRWTHFAYRGDGEIFEVLVDGEPGVGPSVPYDGTLGAHDTVFIAKQGSESWGGRIDDFRLYRRALTDEEILNVMEGVAPSPEPNFLRGDADGNGSLQITDAIATLDYLFAGNVTPTCRDALDWNDNGGVELTDAVANLNYQFAGGEAAPAPGSQDCGPDPTDDPLGCESFAFCQ